MIMKEIVYFEFNDWIAGKDFPNDEIFRKWIIDNQFKDNEWCIENKLCVLCGAIDMSMNYCVAAPRTWVEKHCPKLLTDEEYTYKTVRIHCDDKGNEKRTVKEHTKSTLISFANQIKMVVYMGIMTNGSSLNTKRKTLVLRGTKVGGEIPMMKMTKIK